LVGDNGHGKTNLLEAIHYLVLFRSFRGAPDRDLVAFGSAGFHVAGAVENGSGSQRTVTAGFDARLAQKRVTVDAAPHARLSRAIGSLRAVLLSPDDRELVAGPPAVRRRFLDVLLALVEPGYLEALRQYRQALRQRNAALRRQRATAATVFEPVLGEAGSRITAARQRWVASVGDRFAAHVAALGERAPVELAYRGSTDVIDYAATRDRDLARGSTLEGPHRDDLALSLAGRPLATFGSSGQQRTGGTALRLLEAWALEEPVLLMDDAFAELDAERRGRLAELVEGQQRVLAVPTDADLPGGAGDLPRWRIEQGAVRAA
jgi:DNA replication and repair protein RecF